MTLFGTFLKNHQYLFTFLSKFCVKKYLQCDENLAETLWRYWFNLSISNSFFVLKNSALDAEFFCTDHAPKIWCLPKDYNMAQHPFLFAHLVKKFHQHFMLPFFIRKCFAQLFSSYVFAKKALSYEKHMRKMLMKLTPGKKNFSLTKLLWQGNKIYNLFGYNYSTLFHISTFKMFCLFLYIKILTIKSETTSKDLQFFVWY